MNIAIYCVIAVLVIVAGALIGMSVTLYTLRPIIIAYRRLLNKREIEILNYPKASEHKDADDDQAVVQYDQAEDYGRISLDKKLKIKFIVGDRLLKMQVLEFSGLYSFQPGGFIRQGFASYLGKDIVALGTPGVVETTRYFESTAARKEYLVNIVTSITNELFTVEGELKVGEMCEVQDGEFERWEKRKLIAVLPKQYEKRFITEMKNYPYEHSSWDCARPIAKRIEPKIEECGNVITATWEEK